MLVFNLGKGEHNLMDCVNEPESHIVNNRVVKTMMDSIREGGEETADFFQ